MHLQDGTRYLWGNRTPEGLGHDIGFSDSVYHNQNLFRLHNGLDSHGVSLCRNILRLLKKAGVGLTCALGQIHQVGFLFKGSSWLIEANVTVVAKSQKL